MKNPLKKAKADPESAKRTSKTKPIKTAKSPRFILFVGDEGAVLVYLKEERVAKRLFVGDPKDSNVSTFRELLSSDSKAEILMVADTIDQSYVQHILPPVTVLSVNKLIKRRLDRDFRAEDIKGAISLGREEGGRKDWIFLLISLEKTPSLAAWIDLVIDLPNRFMGIALMPVEAEAIVQQLETAIHTIPDETAAEWQFLVSHNKVGGVRQVILKNGRIIFTRLAQPAGEVSSAAVAGNIEQEILSTIEYMKRLSYQDKAGLNLYIIVSSDIKQAIDPQKLNASYVNIMTPHEAAQHLNIQGATQVADQYGDVILAAAIGRMQKPILKLSTPISEKLDKIYNIRLIQKVAAAIVAVGILIWGGMEFLEMNGVRGELENYEKQKNLRTQELADLRIEVEKSPEKIEKINDLVDLYSAILSEIISPRPFLVRLSAALDEDVRVQNIEWNVEDAPHEAAGAPPASAPVPPLPTGNDKETLPINMNVKLKVVFLKYTESNKAFLERAHALLTKMQNTFKECDVQYSDLPGMANPNEQIDIALGTKETTAIAGKGFVEAEMTFVVLHKTEQSTDAAAAAAVAPGAGR